MPLSFVCYLIILNMLISCFSLDRFVIEHLGSTSKNKDESKPISLLAVFDGHGGSACSQFCSDWISSYVRKKNPHYPHNLPRAMSTAFTKVSVYDILLLPLFFLQVDAKY